jgi:dTMP kinase|tara:strand:- start:183 stop:836 length:654 start_codon:yes stop_codon:yes gene_type:complete
MITGVFITLEGGEGAGKSTQLKLLEERLATHEIDIVRTREPGGVPSAETIRDLLVNGETDKWRPLTETLLHFAARHEHISRLVQPALDRGQWVLCDRFADSTTAYQGYAQNIDLETIATLYRLAVGNLEPNLTIILDLPVEVGLERAEDRGIGGTRYEKMGIEFHKRLRDGFLRIAANNPHRCSILDATQSIEEISEYIMALVEERFLSTPSKGKRS